VRYDDDDDDDDDDDVNRLHMDGVEYIFPICDAKAVFLVCMHTCIMYYPACK
jgi:hypothetical protein